MLSRDDYRLMEVKFNNKQSLQPLDADNAKASIYYIRQKFIRYARKTLMQVICQIRRIRKKYCDRRYAG